MCNAYNHPPGCTCGWGGEGHQGRSPGGWRKIGRSYVRNNNANPSIIRINDYIYEFNIKGEDWLQAIKCDNCKAEIFQAHYNNGIALFDSTEYPWTSHECEKRWPYYFLYRKKRVRNLNVELPETITVPDVEDVQVGVIVAVNFMNTNHRTWICVRLQSGNFLRGRICIKKERPPKRIYRTIIGEIVIVLKGAGMLYSVGQKIIFLLTLEPEYTVGEAYLHGTFGRGFLVEIEPRKHDSMLKIDFENHGTKNLLGSIAGLAKV